MGFTPQEVGAMTWWEFLAAFDGFALSKGVEPEPEPMSVERLDELVAGQSNDG